MHTRDHNNPLRYALGWILTYVVLVTISDAVSESLGLPALTSIVLAALTIFLLVHLHRTNRSASYGIRRAEPGTLPRVLFFLPLFAISVIQFMKGVAPGLTAEAIFFTVVLVSSVALLEELIFRGFLLQALRARGGVTRAIIISGVTFGLGHIVNVVRGASTGADQALQIVAASLIGIALAYCVVLTGSILPGVIIHATFNLSGSLTPHTTPWDLAIIGPIAVVSAVYIMILHKQLKAHGPAPTAKANPSTTNPGAAPIQR
ncbi:membrane protease YdiL (CAAX protease family) [Arthrobacter sp. CAN_A2]|uniref:CPBP family intramembrane glutamic endopeptidase n=1 Tax=Arthrobacter sp. CAN_A2 TaxID=2787718 RepID=UPI0018EFB2D6